MGNAPHKTEVSDPFFEDSTMVPAIANLKRDPTQKLGVKDEIPRGLLGGKDERLLWGVFEDESLSTHANSTVVVESKWAFSGERAIVVLGSGILVGNVSADAGGIVERTDAGYGRIASQWVLTAGHCIYHPQHGLAQEVRVRIPNIMKYQKSRAKLPMLDRKDAQRHERFLTLEGTPQVHPRYSESPDSFSGQDIGLIRLSNIVERIGLPLRAVEEDYEPEVLAVGGYPAQRSTAYHLHVSASRYARIQDKSDIETDYKFAGIDYVGDSGFAMVRYSNQVTPGQSGGPISAYVDGDRPGSVIGIHCNEDDRVGGENSGTLITQNILDWIAQVQSDEENRKPTSPRGKQPPSLAQLLIT